MAVVLYVKFNYFYIIARYLYRVITKDDDDGN